MDIRSLIIVCLSLIFLPYSSAQEATKIVFEDEDGCLRYHADQENNYLPDYSYAGYKNGEVPIPELPVVKSITPIEGDNTAHIQAALDELASIPLDENGFRGALLLEAGIYEVHGTVIIRESGIVLRGVGDDNEPSSNTILLGIGNTPTERDIIQAGKASNASWTRAIPGTRSTITNDFVPAGARSLKVTAPELYSAGNNVIIRHPSTPEWLASINFGDTDTDDPWTPGTIDLVYNRYITGVDFEENKITLDAPIFDHFDRSLSQAEIYVLNKENIKQNIGIENLRIDIQTEGALTENHAKNGIRLIGVEDCWVRNITALHFIYAAVDTRLASRVTVKDCRGIQPHSLITGARRYNFAVGAESNLILFENCYATEGRHSFVSNGASTVSGIVFYNCTSEIDYSASEGHRRWSQGLLFDNISFLRSETTRLVGLYNRGSFGTGHGWSSTSSTAWGVEVPISRLIILQKPPQRQNYAIACQAIVTNVNTFTHPLGYVEATNRTPRITSLYAKQLETRLQKGVPPDAPAQLEAELLNGMVQLHWMDIASQETTYTIELSTDGGLSFSEIAQLPEDETSFLHTDLPNFNGQLIYRVFARNEQCPSPYSNQAAINIVSSTQSLPIPNLKVFPSPFSDFITIQSDSPNELLIRVFDGAGKAVMEQSSTIHLDTTNWGSGTYYLQISDKKGRRSIRKIIKQ